MRLYSAMTRLVVLFFVQMGWNKIDQGNDYWRIFSDTLIVDILGGAWEGIDILRQRAQVVVVLGIMKDLLK